MWGFWLYGMYREFGEAGVLAGFQQYVWRCRRNAVVWCLVCTPITVLVILFSNSRCCCQFRVILGVGWLWKSLVMRRAWVLLARVVPMMGHWWRQRRLGGRCRQAVGTVNGGDFSWRAHHWEEDWEKNQAIQHPQNSENGQHSKKIPERYSNKKSQFRENKQKDATLFNLALFSILRV